MASDTSASKTNLNETSVSKTNSASEESLLLSSQAMTLEDLPPADTKRWVIRRKAEVVAGVRLGLISLEDACRRYHLSLDEFSSWQRLIEHHGLRGLRATRLQEYRDKILPPAKG